MKKLNRIFPFLEWLPSYNLRLFRGDLLAGLTVAVMLVPQGMAYGMLAGLPPIYGLYAAVVPLLVYAFFGTSRQLTVGPVALVSLLVLAGIEPLAERGSMHFVELAIATALLAGVIQLLMGLFRMGFLVNFLSQPVLAGFASAAAFIIGFSQIGKLLGLQLTRSNYVYEILLQLIQKVDQVHLMAVGVGVAGILLMLVLRRINRAIPGALITIVLATSLVAWLQLDQTGLEIVGTVPSGLPKWKVPGLTWQDVRMLFPLALTISLISFIESLAIAKTMERRMKNHKVIPNQELIALGITKIVGAFFQAFPTTGSFTRSAINQEAGAQTGISSVVSAVLIGLTLLFLTPLFYYLPETILAAIILVAVLSLIHWKEALFLWKHDRRDFAMLLITFLGTLAFGIQLGVVIGLVLSLIIFIYRNSVPHVAVLGKLPHEPIYRNVTRFPEAQQPSGALIVRFDAQLYFGNANYFLETMESLVNNKGDELRLFILDASSIHDIDSSGLQALKDFLDYLDARSITFYLSGAIGPVRDILDRTGLCDRIGRHCQFGRVHDAIKTYLEVPVNSKNKIK